ncbi:MAG TPA: phosphoribosylanthranilate isomerase [Pyrinomonadaceae bacterium]
MTFVKICGITNLEDALAAVDAGADALGFNFYPRSPRYIDPVLARSIIQTLPANILTVGVFVNEEKPEKVEKLARKLGVKALQLHGDESPAFCASLANHFVIKVLALGPGFDINSILNYHVDAFMVDAFDRASRGGTGRVIDWSVARNVCSHVPRLFLAGGLSAQNVAEGIEFVKPYGVDACSALEISPGRKDAEKMRAFVAAARGAKIKNVK